jgi:hypothetical protein
VRWPYTVRRSFESPADGRPGAHPHGASAQRDDNPGMSSLVIGLIVVYAVFFALINLIVTWRAA